MNDKTAEIIVIMIQMSFYIRVSVLVLYLVVLQLLFLAILDVWVY